MLEEQMDLFSTDWSNLPKEKAKAKIYSFQEEKVKENNDIRTENQLNRKYAYDVGEKIFGSRKEEAKFALRLWNNKKSVEGLREIERLDNKVAAEIITREAIFSDFSLESEKENGVDPQVARLKQLIIQRINKVPKDTEEARHYYFVGASWVKEQLNSAYTWKDMNDVIFKIRSHTGPFLPIENKKNKIQRLIDDISFFESDKNRKLRNVAEIETLKSQIEKHKKEIEKIRFAESLCLSSLGKKFTSFFNWDGKSSKQTIRTVLNSVETWDDLLTRKQSDSKTKRKIAPVWERKLPENPSRIGGIQSMVHTAEDLMNTFNFKGIQFGNWTNDHFGSTHIFKSSEGFYDLADILNMKDISNVSLNGTLGMAYGARGRGNANAHYESGETVINITRNHLGALGHEWGHAFDNYLYRYSHNFENGQEKMLSELYNIGEYLPASIVKTYRDLIAMFTEGRAIRYEPYNGERYSRISVRLIRLYEEYKDDILGAMKEIFKSEEDHINNKMKLQKYYNSASPGKIDVAMTKVFRKAEKNLRLGAKVLAFLHYEATGEQLKKVPVPTFTTSFFEASLELDRNVRGKYWSNVKELFARSFEAWIEDKLSKQGRRNDYLVCGTQDPLAYPQGKEREIINNQFDLLFEQLREIELFK